MKKNNWMELLVQETEGMVLSTQTKALLDTNQYSKKYGLVLKEEDASALLIGKKETLKAERRVEFGETILPKLIYAFCDSDWINQEDYRETLLRLQGIFYLYKNEMLDEITDDELIAFMREQFETVCGGDLDYLESTCLDIFAQAIRAGYSDYQQTGGEGSYQQLDLVPRWDKELYLEALRDLCWR